MPIGWMTVLKSVPWGDVVSNAPKVAAGAKKLWKTVAQKPQPLPIKTHGNANAKGLHGVVSAEAQAITALKTRVLELEAATVELEDQMVESSGLIAALAEQNSQLIMRIDAMQLKILWLAAALVLTGAATALCLAMVFYV